MIPIRTALVVDDDSDLLMLCKVTLETFTGWTVAVARSADAAVALATRESPDVILLDVMMPGDGGLGVLERLKSGPETAHIPVVLMTAADQTGLGRGRAHGARGLIAKPFEPASLPGEIRRILGEEPGS